MIRSWLVSKRGGVLPPGIGNTSITPMPGSRNGRATPSSTTWKTPVVLELALDSVMLPSEPATTTALATVVRMPSNFSALSGVDAALKSALLSVIGAGSGLPLDNTTIVGPVNWVIDRWLRLLLGTNSATVPVTRMRLPTAAEAGGAVEVKTKMPCEVFGSASTFASGVCRKKPLLNFSAVTMPSVVTVAPISGEVVPLPWMSWIGTTATSSFWIVPTPWASATVAPVTLARLTKKVSSASGVVSPSTLTANVVELLPAGIVRVPDPAT